MSLDENIRIVRWSGQYHRAFVRLNRAWIERYFHLEASDLIALGDPQREIIDKGGEIFFALAGDRVEGCCALVHHPETDQYELAKMAVDAQMQGRGIGLRLATALLQYAQAHGIERIYLEANTLLAASVGLYRKIGFREAPGLQPAYRRCNLMMEWLNPDTGNTRKD